MSVAGGDWEDTEVLFMLGRLLVHGGNAFYSLLSFHLVCVYFGFLGNVPWKSVVGKVVATCFSFAFFLVFHI